MAPPLSVPRTPATPAQAAPVPCLRASLPAVPSPRAPAPLVTATHHLPTGPPSSPGQGDLSLDAALPHSDPYLVPRGLRLFGGPTSQSGKRLLRGGTGCAWSPEPPPRLPWGLGHTRPDLPAFQLLGGEPGASLPTGRLGCSRTFSSHCPVRSAPAEGTQRRLGRALSPVSSLLNSRLPGGPVPGAGGTAGATLSRQGWGCARCPA